MYVQGVPALLTVCINGAGLNACLNASTCFIINSLPSFKQHVPLPSLFGVSDVSARGLERHECNARSPLS
jgi:hypothetical protein